ncbi:Anti-sigma-E factor ChrR [Methylobrevis pamukkalensis]|uniref:Anti-sigma-E factor ChrR n=1 Tax=Methylobrevis pamukkalensis TaxID=1439726 RepID=A0A1E3GY78_9HYPH|nr:Anti-sigma-E factor ChrR [Methylobrevis pamukkalensis]
MPVHTHHGCEVTLVVEGSFSDVRGRFVPGDIDIADDSIDHKPVAGAEADCICFAVCDAPVKLTGRFGRLLNPLIRA